MEAQEKSLIWSCTEESIQANDNTMETQGGQILKHKKYLCVMNKYKRLGYPVWLETILLPPRRLHVSSCEYWQVSLRATRTCHTCKIIWLKTQRWCCRFAWNWTATSSVASRYGDMLCIPLSSSFLLYIWVRGHYGLPSNWDWEEFLPIINGYTE